MKNTATDIGDPGAETNTGYGLINVKAAFDKVMAEAKTPIQDPQPIKESGTWGTKKQIAKNLLYTPAVTSTDSKKIDMFLIGRTSRHLGYRRYQNGKWQSSKKIDDSLSCFSTPAAVARGSDTIDVVVLGSDRTLHHLEVKDGKSNGEWTNLNSGPCLFAPTIVARGSDILEVYVVLENANRHLYRKQFQGGSWNDEWEQIGGVCSSAPTAVAQDDGPVDVFVQGLDGRVYWKQHRNNEWGPFEPVGELIITHGLAATRRDKDHLDLFAIGPEGALYQKEQRADTWMAWEKIGGVWFHSPAAVASTKKDIDVFLTSPPTPNDPKTYLWHKTWSASI